MLGLTFLHLQLNDQLRSLEEREAALREGMLEMRRAAQQLNSQQQQLSKLDSILQDRQVQQERKENQLEKFQLEKFSSSRRYLSEVASHEELKMEQKENTSPLPPPLIPHIVDEELVPSNEVDWMDSFKRKLSQSKGSKVLMLNSESNKPIYEIQEAKKTLQESRVFLASTLLRHHVQTELHLRRETDFLTKLKHYRNQL